MKSFCIPGPLDSTPLVFAPLGSVSASAQSTPDVPERYKRLFFEYADRRLLEKALNLVGKTTLPVGRSFALIAGVTQYPNFPLLEQSLKAAAVDIEKLKLYLKDQEFFDEIVVLKDAEMNLDNLNYFLETYFPERLSHSPHSRFLFAYSGHGYAVGPQENPRGFLLTNRALSLADTVERIDLSLLRTLLGPTIESAEKVLVLVNACQSGAFLGRKPFGLSPFDPGARGAHAIMASRSNQKSWQVDFVGPGSVFFEKILAGLDGAADYDRDGIVTYPELNNYLQTEIPLATGGNQTPVEGDISRDGSVGGFFFLNRSHQVRMGNAKPWNPGNALQFGVPRNEILEQGRSAFSAGRYNEAIKAFLQAASAGNTEAIDSLGRLFDMGFGITEDYRQARQCYEKTAAAGNDTAMYRLGSLYEHGYGVPQDYQQAGHWYKKAAAAGNAPAMYSLGSLYENGEGIAKDPGEARQWYTKAAAAGNEEAAKRLKSMPK